MKFACKWIAAYLLLVISIWLIALPVSAIDYSPIEDFFETMLVDPQLGTSINAADVTIYASQVTIDYTTSASSLIEVGNDIAVVVMFYKKIADDYPEVGDLLILARSHPGGTPTKFSCRKSWISNLDGNDANAIGDVVGNVIETSSSS